MARGRGSGYGAGMPTNKYALDCAAFDAPDQIGRRMNTLLADLWYPGLPGNATHVEIGLLDVRAADSIRIHYDFGRDGYAIEQAGRFEWDVEDETCDPDWQEVAFVQAWARDPREHPPAPTSPAPDVHASCRRSFDRVLAERNAMIDASEEKRLVALADELDEDNRATDARLLRAALAELGRYRTAAK